RRTTRCRCAGGIGGGAEPPPCGARAGASGGHRGASPPRVRRGTVPTHDRGRISARGPIVKRALLRSPAFGRDLRRWLKSHPDTAESVEATLDQLSADAAHPSLRTHK